MENMRSMGRRELSNDPPAATGQPVAVPAGAIGVGARVEHAKFGRGTVTAIEHMSGDVKLTIDFAPPTGTRTLLQKFAKLTLV
jgi:DNA helicase-2/ATP-dependent DNA helicase PcrA